MTTEKEITNEIVNGVGVFKLSKPTLIDGEMKSEIEYDLDSLTGKDSQQAVFELAQRNIMVGMTEVDQNYHAALFAAASGLALDDVWRMSTKDYTKACNLVRDFFLSA